MKKMSSEKITRLEAAVDEMLHEHIQRQAIHDSESLEPLKREICLLLDIREVDFHRKTGKQKGRQRDITRARAAYVFVRELETGGKISLSLLSKELGYSHHRSIAVIKSDAAALSNSFKGMLQQISDGRDKNRKAAFRARLGI